MKQSTRKKLIDVLMFDLSEAFDSIRKLCRIHAFFFIRTSNRLSAEAGLFLTFWLFQPQIVLKLFLFPDILNSGLVFGLKSKRFVFETPLARENSGENPTGEPASRLD